MGSFSFMK